MTNSSDYINERIKEEYFNRFGLFPTEITRLPNSTSGRVYFRIFAEGGSIIATYCSDREEAFTFVYLSNHFRKNGLNVPEIIHYKKGSDIYFQSDLGDTTFHEFVEKNGAEKSLPLCKKILEDLVDFQVTGAKDLDFSICFPRPEFDEVSVLWDLNYFKYSFLKPSGINYHEDRLEKDLRNLAADAVSRNCNNFLYRDFQSRNIMIQCDELYYIDYQGGRRGSLCYDPASFIYSARSPFDINVKDELLAHYRNVLINKNISVSDFDELFYHFLLIRILQTFGAYGYRGWFERKQAFYEILPKAVKNLNELLPRFKLLEQYPELNNVVRQLALFSYEKPVSEMPGESSLIVDIYSFSYKEGIPVDDSGNGGGFVFDCRALPNPGKQEKYKNLSGIDSPVIDYLSSKSEVTEFLGNVNSVVAGSVQKYVSRGFTHLMVSFGCTGGQHRSVYCAEKLAAFIRSNFPVKVQLCHKMQKEWGRKD